MRSQPSEPCPTVFLVIYEWKSQASKPCFVIFAHLLLTHWVFGVDKYFSGNESPVRVQMLWHSHGDSFWGQRAHTFNRAEGETLEYHPLAAAV